MINFVEAPTTENMACRRVSEDGKIEIGVYPVLFGFRVRAGYIGAWGPTIDWCCGNDPVGLNIAYNFCLGLLGEGVPFCEFIPSTRVKPVFDDADFRKWLEDMVCKYKFSPENFRVIKLPPLLLIREVYEKHVFTDEHRMLINLARGFGK